MWIPSAIIKFGYKIANHSLIYLIKMDQLPLSTYKALMTQLRPNIKKIDLSIKTNTQANYK